jgi:hypothetical protein
MTVPTGLNRIGFSVTGSTVVPSVGKRYHLTIWPRALSANELQQQFVLLSRNSNATYFDFALNFIEVGPNVSRYGYDFNTGAYLGLLVENAAINFICNPRGENNVPNTVPTNWVAQAGAGLTITHIGPVTLNGIPYVDIRFVGTTNGTYMVYVFDNTSPVPFNVGDLITLSFYCQLVGGSLTNITSMNLTYRFNTIPINSSFTPTSTLQRYATTATVPIGATTVQTGFQFSCNSGVAIDITLRFALPQTEFGASASSPILNVPGVRNLAPTRAADVQGSAPTFSANAVGQVGTVSEQSTELLLGVGGMAQLGSVIVQNIKPTSGVYTTGLVGFVSFFQQKLAVPVGVGVTGQPGSITVSVQNIEPIIGISGSGQVGNVSRQLSELLLGVAGAGQFGNVVANDQITIALPFYRTTSASYIDDNGALQTVGPNVARYQSGALLLEPVATNLCTFPTIGGTGWTNTNATVVTNDASVLAPDGSHTASYLQDNAVNTQHYTSIATSSLVTNNVYTHSVFARISTNKYLCIYFDTTTYAVFDLSFGTIPTKIGVTATISQLGPTSWYRCSITATKKLTHNSLLFLPSSTYLAYVGNLTGIELWGLQTETGSVATSYTPTNRDADTTTASYGRPGSITEEIDIGTSGIASSGQVGNVSGLPIEVLLGLSAAGQMGTTIAQSFQSLTNVTGLGQANIVATAKGGGLTASGVFGASQTGSLTTSIQDVRASGTLATGQVGSAINQPAKILIGNSGIGQQGSLIVQAVTSVIGAPGIGQSGNAISTIIPVTSGVTAIGKTGNVSAIDTACITVGVSSAGQSGLVVDTISSTTTIAGVAASAQIGLISFRSGSDIAVFGTSTTGQAGIATDYQVTNVLTSTGIGQVGHSIDQIGALVQLPIVPTGQAGSVTTKVDDSYVISGAIATGQAGLASSQIDQPKTILGKLAIGQAGTMAIQSDNIQQCQGAVVIGLAGSVLTTVDDTGAISGNFATGQMGSMVTSASRLLSSNAAIGLVGTTRTIHVAPVPSIAATGIVGTISLSIFSIGGNSTITAPSVSVNGQVGSVASKLDQVKATLAGAVAQGSPGLVTPNVGFVPGARVATGQAGSILIQTDSNVTPHGVSAIGAANSIPRATLLIGNSAYGNCNSPIAIVSSLLTGQFATGAIGSLRMLSIPITGRSGVGMAGSMHTSRLFGALISGNVTGGDAGNMHTTAVVRKKIAIPVYVMVY